MSIIEQILLNSDGSTKKSMPVTIVGGETNYFKVDYKDELTTLSEAKPGSTAYVSGELRLYMLTNESYSDIEAWYAISEYRPIPPQPVEDIEIYTAEDLNKIRYKLNSNYTLMNDIDLSEYPNWRPIGDSNNPFTGTFNGNGYTISNLNITDTGSEFVGFFGYVEKHEYVDVIRDLNINGEIELANSESYCVGAIAGTLGQGRIVNCKSEVDIIINDVSFASIGGLIGNPEQPHYGDVDILNSNVEGLIEVSGEEVIVGGLGTMLSNIRGSYFNGDIQITARRFNATGGLAGIIGGEVFESYAIGSITINDVEELIAVAGLVAVGVSYITRSYSDMEINISNVRANIFGGGLIGLLEGGESVNIHKSCSRGKFITTDCENEILVGGMIGSPNVPIAIIRESYTAIESEVLKGALLGHKPSDDVIIENTYWDKDITKQEHAFPDDTNYDLLGKTTEEMMKQATYENWDFDNTWKIKENETYAKLKIEPVEPEPLPVEWSTDGETWLSVEKIQEAVDAIESTANKTGFIRIIRNLNMMTNDRVLIPAGVNVTVYAYGKTAGSEIKISRGETFGSMFITYTGSKLTFGDTEKQKGTLIVDGGKNDEIISTSSMVYNNKGIITMNDGAILQNNNGGGVYNDRGTFEMNGGEIKGNKATTGAGVYNNAGITGDPATFKLNGGIISENEATGNGAGVYNYYGTTFIMRGGEVINNTANGNGAGIYNTSGGTFIMSGGIISGNVSGGNGEGIYKEGVFNLSGTALIEQNNDIYLFNAQKIIVTDELINDEQNFIITPNKIDEGTVIAVGGNGYTIKQTDADKFKLSSGIENRKLELVDNSITIKAI